jgi:hypothetical protein
MIINYYTTKTIKSFISPFNSFFIIRINKTYFVTAIKYEKVFLNRFLELIYRPFPLYKTD